MQCTHNVTLRRVYVTVVAVEKQCVLYIISVYLCSCLRYPAFKSRLLCAATYCHLWPVWV